MDGGGARLNRRLFGCQKFSRLSNEQADRELTPAEQKFLERHRGVCDDCAQLEQTTACALNMLRMAALEPEVAPMFEDRVIRRLRVQQVKESLNYWSPALVGAGIACIVIFVTLQLASSSVQTGRANIPAARANLTRTPRLELDHIPVIR